MAGNSVEVHSASNPPNHSDTLVNRYNIPSVALAKLHSSLFSFNSQANELCERVTNPVREFIRPFHQTGSAYRCYGIADAINLSFSLFSLGYFFQHAYQQSSQLLSPQEFQLTVKEFHDAEKTPEGLALVVIFTVFLVGFSTLGSFYDEKKDAPWVKYLMFIWPYVRDAGKQFKWTDKGEWAALSLLVQYNVVNQDFLVQNMFFMAWAGGLFSAVNRIWLRWMRDQRKEMVKTNLDLIEGIKSPLHQMEKMPKCLKGYERSLVFLQETEDSQESKTLFYINDLAESEPIQMEEKDWDEFCKEVTNLQTENIQARMKQYLSYSITHKSKPNPLKWPLPSRLHFIDAREALYDPESTDEVQHKFWDSYIYLSQIEGVEDRQRLFYIDKTGVFIEDGERSESFHNKYIEAQKDKNVLNLSTLQVKSILHSKVNGDGKQLDHNYVQFVNLRRDILATDSDWIQGYELALMTDLYENNPELAQNGKIYLSEQGNGYIVRDLNGKLQRGQLDDIDLTDVATRLNDPTLKTAILQATSKVGHTQITSLIKQQSDLVAWIAPLSAAASALGDGLYFYIFVAKLTMATLSPPMAMLMLGTSVALFMVCMVTRIAEEFDFQRRLQVTVLRTEAELSKKDCGFLYEQLDKLMEDVKEETTSSDKLQSVIDAVNSSMEGRKKQLERHGISTTPQVVTEPMSLHKQTTMLLWSELYYELKLSKILQDKLRAKLDRSCWAAAFEGLQNGLALQGAIASFSFMVSTLCYISAATCPPAFMLGCLAVGIGAIIISCILAYSSHESYLKKVEETKQEMSLKFHEDMLFKMMGTEEDIAHYDDLKQACNYVSHQPLDPPVDFMVIEWSEIFRLLFKGATKGRNAAIEILGSFLKDSDNLWALPFVIVAGIASFTWALGMRAAAKGLVVSRPDNAMNSGAPERKARKFFDRERCLDKREVFSSSFSRGLQQHLDTTADNSDDDDAVSDEGENQGLDIGRHPSVSPSPFLIS